MSYLQGKISLDKRIRRHPVWQREPFSYGQAFTDLLLLAVDANSAPQTITVNGESFKLERGQVGWSLQRLADEWNRSRDWVSRFMVWCQDEGMLKVDSNRRRTIISIVNYDAYQATSPATDLASDESSEPATDLASDESSEPATDLASDKAHKWKEVREIGKGKAPPIEENSDFAEVPPEAEVMAFAAAFPGDMARGIPAVMPERWAVDWLRYKVGSGQWPKKWREKMVADFQSDWVKGIPKARGGAAAPPYRGGQTSGRSAAQARFELSRELEDVQARLDACHENGTPADRRDQAREKELLKQIGELPK